MVSVFSMGGCFFLGGAFVFVFEKFFGFVSACVCLSY